MKLIYCLTIFLWPFVSTGQKIKPLTIGDKVPDITISNVYNYPSSTIRLSDLKGKLVILDFWSIWCGACIDAFPKMEKLQKEFNSQVQIILVNVFSHDSVKKVQSFFEKRKLRTGKEVQLPYSLLQSSIAPYFPFRFIPHYIWIDKKGKIIAITSQTEATSENVKNAINGNVAGIHNKIDLLHFSLDTPLFVNGNGGDGNDFLYRTLFTKYIEGLGNTSGVEKDSHGRITRFFMFNNAPIALLRAAYPKELNCPLNRIIAESGNKQIFQQNADSLFYKNSFCYDLTIPSSTIEEIQDYMKDDMKRYLGVRVISEKRIMKCLVLNKSASINKLITKGRKSGMDFSKTSIQKFMHNEPIGDLINLLNNLPAAKTTPFIDRSDISQNIDLELPTDLYALSLNSLKSFLQKNGFEVIEAERDIKVSVITDNKN